MTVHVDHLEVLNSPVEFPLPAVLTRPFPPAAPESSALTSRTAGERRALAMVYGAFLTGDDPYLDAFELAQLFENKNFNEDCLRHELAGLGFAGLLGVTYSRHDFEIEQVECTTVGLEAFCRGSMAERYETLLCEVARRIIQGAIDGQDLRRMLPWETGLLLTHAVQALCADGWVTVSGDFSGNWGWQITHVSPELDAWAAAERAAIPSVWTLSVVESDTTVPAAA